MNPPAIHPERFGQSDLFVALGISVVLHLFIGLPIAADYIYQQAARAAIESDMPNEQSELDALQTLLNEHDRDPLEITPGMDNGDPASMTWIGFDQYEEHLAALGQVDQAAFTMQMAGIDPSGLGSEGGADPTPAPGAQPVPLTPPTPTTQESPLGEHVAEATNTPESNHDSEQSPLPVDAPPTEASELDNPPALNEPRDVSAPQGLAGSASSSESIVEQDQPAQPVQPAPIVPHTPTPVIAGENSIGGGTLGGHPGTQSDRESEPRAIINVPPKMWRTGKPLVALGLEIRTRKPSFPLLTRITTVPSNPIAEIFFDRDGKPAQCRIVQTSGYPSEIDEPVIDSLYRWRASGKQLKSLEVGQTVRFVVRVILR
ncbi:MAG: hypothetical protein O2800_05890 [Planctomycetota bacterium]|nr:hypothetical protein [Planctomycetota bacterium]